MIGLCGVHCTQCVTMAMTIGVHIHLKVCLLAWMSGVFFVETVWLAQHIGKCVWNGSLQLQNPWVVCRRNWQFRHGPVWWKILGGWLASLGVGRWKYRTCKPGILGVWVGKSDLVEGGKPGGCQGKSRTCKPWILGVWLGKSDIVEGGNPGGARRKLTCNVCMVSVCITYMYKRGIRIECN